MVWALCSRARAYDAKILFISPLTYYLYIYICIYTFLYIYIYIFVGAGGARLLSRVQGTRFRWLLGADSPMGPCGTGTFH